MKVAIVLVLLAMGVFADTTGPHMNCLPQVDFAFFDLRSLESNNTDFISYYNSITKKDFIAFSLCQPTVTKCNNHPTHAVYNVDEKRCVSLTGVSPYDASFKMLDEKNRSYGVQVNLTGGDDNSALTLNIKCGPTVKIADFKRRSTKELSINMTSPAGCPKLDVKPLYDYISGEIWILKAVLIVVGLLLTFLGRQLVKPALFTLGFGAFFVFSTFVVFGHFITAATPVWGLWTLLAICVMASALVGTLAAMLEAVGFFAVGMALGYAFGSFIMMSVLVHTNLVSVATITYSIMSISGVLFGIAMVKFRDILIIVATSLFGSLMVSRTFLAAVASLPTEPEILSMFENHVPIPNIVWGYLALYVVLAGLGIWIQKSRKTAESDDKNVIHVANSGPYGYYQRA